MDFLRIGGVCILRDLLNISDFEILNVSERNLFCDPQQVDSEQGYGIQATKGTPYACENPGRGIQNKNNMTKKSSVWHKGEVYLKVQVQDYY